MIPFVDLKKQYLLLRESLENAISGVCASSKFILGPEVERFEKNFASYLGVKEAVGVGNGTDALHLSFYALKLGHGDEVLAPANTFIATALAIYNSGAIPVPVDVCPESFLMDMTSAEKQLTKHTKAIIPVHLYGQSMDMDSVLSFAKKHNLIVIEDACQAHGAMWKGKRVGSFGIAGCFSFYPAKNLGAYGDGGIVTINDPKLTEKLRMLRNYGSIKKYAHKISGTNSRLDSMQAAVLNVKLNFLDEWNKKRFQAACRYTEALKYIKAVKTPVFDHNDISRHVFHLFVIQCERRDELSSFLAKRGIECSIHYPVPIHLHQAFASLGIKKGSFPAAEMLADKILSLPMFPEITDEQIDTVVMKIKKFYG